MPKWRIYYDDRSTYDSDDGPPELAPPLGVQAVVYSDKDLGRYVVTRFDYYCWHIDEEEWYGHDIFGMWDYFQLPGWKKVTFGRSIETPLYQEILHTAINDPDFPQKSAVAQHERVRVDRDSQEK